MAVERNKKNRPSLMEVYSGAADLKGISEQIEKINKRGKPSAGEHKQTTRLPQIGRESTSDRSTDQSSTLSSDRSCDRLTDRSQPIDLSSDLSIDRSTDLSTNHSSSLSTAPSDIGLRDSLYAIYVCLRKLEGKMSNAELLSKRLDIPVETVRGIIKRLKKYGVIRDSRKIRNGFAQGAICELNSEMRVYLAGTDRRKTQIALGLAAQAIDPSQMYDPLQKDGDGAVASNPSTHLTSTLSTAPSARTPAELHSSSILNLEEKTTTWGRQEILAELEIPVHSYWVEKGITAKTIQDWAQKHKLEVPVIFRSMEHCRWDIERNGKKVTSNEMGLLYGSLKAHGIYYEPKGYKTHAQEQAERAREILERDMQILAELKESNLKREQLKVEIEFEKMMADEHCEMYQACLQMQPKAMRDSRTGPDLRRMQPDVFRDGMWNAFREIKNKTPLPE